MTLDSTYSHSAEQLTALLSAFFQIHFTNQQMKEITKGDLQCYSFSLSDQVCRAPVLQLFQFIFIVLARSLRRPMLKFLQLRHLRVQTLTLLHCDVLPHSPLPLISVISFVPLMFPAPDFAELLCPSVSF